jgi:hypothetical protein
MPLLLSQGHRSELSKSTFESLLYSERWFDLRRALQGNTAPSLVRGSVAAEFNNVRLAEELLGEVIRNASESDDAAYAHGRLGVLYKRIGRSRDALTEFSQFQRLRPDDHAADEELKYLNVWSRYPQQSLIRWAPSRIPYVIKRRVPFIPLTVNGKSANYVLDTGNGTGLCICESERSRLGIKLEPADVGGPDATGEFTAFEGLGVAERVALGAVELSSVPVIVLGDDKPMCLGQVAGERGLVGLSILLALRVIRFGPVRVPGLPVLSFLHPIARGRVPSISWAPVAPEMMIHTRSTRTCASRISSF